jgi:hypothetical protein
VFFNIICGSRKGEKMGKMAQEVDNQRNGKKRCKCGQITNLGALRSKIGVRLITEEGYGNSFGEDPNAGLTNGLSTGTMPLHMMS